VIGALRGEVVLASPEGAIVVDVGGVGYAVQTTPRVAAQLAATTGEVRLVVHTHVREDAIVLYGFTEGADRRAFEQLLSAHGVGPALALAVLSTLSGPELAAAVEREDLEQLCTVPGVGRKTAQRLILDLKGRLEQPAVAAPKAPEAVHQEAALVLASLGFTAAEVADGLEDLDPSLPVEEAVRVALKALVRR